MCIHLDLILKKIVLLFQYKNKFHHLAVNRGRKHEFKTQIYFFTRYLYNRYNGFFKNDCGGEIRMDRSMYPKNGKVIFHIDCNAYFASVEVSHDSSLQGKPLVVAGNSRHGMVVTASYEARKLGIYTTMTLHEAKRKCPELIVRAPNFTLYRETSSKIFSFISEKYSDVLERASIDECYVDITDCHHLGTPLHIAKSIQQDLINAFHIPVSIGIAPNKFLAKMANNLSEGMLQISVLRKRDIRRGLWEKPVAFAHGIGEKTAEKLKEVGIETIGDLAKAEERMLRDSFGVHLVRLHSYVNGLDTRPVKVEANYDVKTVGNSKTLPYNTAEERVIVEALEKMAESVSERMKRSHVVTQHVQLTIRYENFRTVTKSKKAETFLQEKHEIFKIAVQLFRKHWEGESVRLVGITALQVVQKREAAKQLDLFSYESEIEKAEPLHTAIEQIKGKFGDGAIQKGTDLLEKKRNNHFSDH